MAVAGLTPVWRSKSQTPQTHATMENLLIVAIVFGVIAVVGHSIWLFATWVLRTMFGPETRRESWREAPQAREPVCPHCGVKMPSRSRWCWNCGLNLTAPQDPDLAEL